MARNWVREFHSTLELYAHGCNEVMIESANKITQQGRRKLEIVSPKRPGSGKYAKSWRVKRVGSKFIVHNKDHYRLTHLLEKGHVNRDGSRTDPRPHMKPVEQEMIRKFVQETENGIENL